MSFEVEGGTISEDELVYEIAEIFDVNFENYISNLPLDFSLPQKRELEDAMEEYLPQIYDFIVELYQKTESGTPPKEAYREMKKEKEWRELTKDIEKVFPEGFFLLSRREIVRKVKKLLEGRKYHLYGKYRDDILEENLIKKNIPSTEIYGGVKYYHPWVERKIENVVPIFYPLRKFSFCPKSPFHISEEEIPYAEINGERIRKEALLNPYICVSELPESVQGKIDVDLFPLRNSKVDLKKEIEDFCFPSAEGGKRCHLYYHPLELGDFSHKIRERNSLDVDIIPKLILGDDVIFSRKANELFDVYIKTSLYKVLTHSIKYIFLLQGDVGVYGYGDYPRFFKKLPIDDPEITISVFLNEKDEKYIPTKIEIPPRMINFNPEFSEKNFFFLEISHRFIKGEDKSVHAVSLLIDKKNKTYEFFSSRGDEVYDPDIKGPTLEAARTILPNYSFVEEEYCPRFGFQGLSDLDNDGFCYLWNLFYIENYIMARRKLSPENFRQISFNRLLRDKLLQAGGPGYISRTIISYFCYKIYQIFSLYHKGEFDSSNTLDIFLVENIPKCEKTLKENSLYSSYSQALQLYQGDVLNRLS